MNILEVIRTRRSIRKFLDKPVSDEDAIQILDAARLAPSGGNRQNWKFIYINEPKILRMIKICCPGFYGDATAAIVAGLETVDESTRPSIIGILDMGFAAQNILLVIHALDLGGCVIGSLNANCIKKIINSPETFNPILAFSIGHPEKQPPTPKKKKLSEIVFINEWGNNWKKLEDIK